MRWVKKFWYYQCRECLRKWNTGAVWNENECILVIVTTCPPCADKACKVLKEGRDERNSA